MNRKNLINEIEGRGLRDKKIEGKIYRRIERIMGEMIEEGKIEKEVGIKKEREIEEKLGIGRIKVRKEYKEIMKKGFVE